MVWLKMPPRYTSSLRQTLPFLFLCFQILSLLIFMFLISSDYSYDQKYLQRYPEFQDINVMIILGFGFLFAFLKRFGFSAVGFSILLVAFGLQWAIILNAFLFGHKDGLRVISFTSLCTGLMSVLPALISFGAVLGKMNPVQLLMMTAFEMPVFTLNRYIMTKYLTIGDHISMMHAHIFGAYFGLSVSWLNSSPSQSTKANKEKENFETTSELFSMFGALFMWMFWPSYNSVLLQDLVQKSNAIYNTYFALAVSVVTVFSVSALVNQEGKLQMSHVRNGMLAGGVAVGYSAFMVQYPWITMTIGFLAGLTSSLSRTFFQRTLNKVSLVHDTCGVHYIFGLPGLLGGITYSLLIISADYNSIEILGYQAIVGIGCILLTLALSLVSGLITGFILKCKLFRPPSEHHFFQDQPFWEATLTRTPAATEATVFLFSPQSMHSEHLRPSKKPDILEENCG
uniref:Ammonium transporter AmtB-like domain-containing protein n=1 Tax=Leptobrachium leishanense TaxID=445787 RepID=A0A8C5MF85_9ANUR